MNKSIMKKFILLKIFNESLIKLPSPINISYWWNFGSLLGMILLIQIISGFMISMHYCPSTNEAFNSIIHIMQDIKYGWIIRFIHINGASFFFICMFIHIGRGIYYQSFKLKETWMIGVTIFLLSMMTAFLGYVLPWGQMSFWGATVITNLISAIPYIGEMLVLWIWGGFSINNATLNRFFSIHFILPIIITLLVIIHLMFLHQTGSNNPMGTNSNLFKINFHNYFSIKDILGFLIFWMIFLTLIMKNPNLLGDPDNFIKANPMNTPVHIQPEWYFLFAYAILRSIPNKLGGVIALIMSIAILYINPFLKFNSSSNKFLTLNQLMFWIFSSSFFILTWMGMQMIESPFIIISQLTSLFYFSYFMLNPLISNIWNNYNQIY